MRARWLFVILFSSLCALAQPKQLGQIMRFALPAGATSAEVTSVSPNGKLFAGYYVDQTGTDWGFVWTQTGVDQNNNPVGNYTRTLANVTFTGINDSGDVAGNYVSGSMTGNFVMTEDGRTYNMRETSMLAKDYALGISNRHNNTVIVSGYWVLHANSPYQSPDSPLYAIIPLN